MKINCAVAKLEAISSRLPSVPLFVSTYVRKEALLSSQIEGTQATLDDILDPHIEQTPIIDIKKTAALLGSSYNTLQCRKKTYGAGHSHSSRQ